MSIVLKCFLTKLPREAPFILCLHFGRGNFGPGTIKCIPFFEKVFTLSWKPPLPKWTKVLRCVTFSPQPQYKGQTPLYNPPQPLKHVKLRWKAQRSGESICFRLELFTENLLSPMYIVNLLSPKQRAQFFRSSTSAAEQIGREITASSPPPHLFILPCHRRCRPFSLSSCLLEISGKTVVSSSAHCVKKSVERATWTDRLFYSWLIQSNIKT